MQDLKPGDTVLYDGPYLKIIKDQSGFERCRDRTGQVVAILPYVLLPGDEVKYVTRVENRSAWSADPSQEFVSSVTGGVEPGEDPKAAAVRELWEEVGCVVGVDEMQDLGPLFGAKCLDTQYYLYAVNVTDRRPKKNGVGDGSAHEKEAYNKLSTAEECLLSEDGILVSMMARTLVFPKNQPLNEL